MTRTNGELPRIDVVIPTIQGRESYLERCIESYKTNSVHPISITIVHDKPCVGSAWNTGANEAFSRMLAGIDGNSVYLHLTNDDITACPGWDVAACQASENGWFPSPQLLMPDGTTQQWGRMLRPIPDGTQVDSTTVPFMSWGLWMKIGPCLDVHYYSDDWLSWRARQEGVPSVYVEGYKLAHHWAQHGRGAGMTESDRMVHDEKIYRRAIDEHDRHDGK